MILYHGSGNSSFSAVLLRKDQKLCLVKALAMTTYSVKMGMITVMEMEEMTI
jgi:hypothetical protein